VRGAIVTYCQPCKLVLWVCLSTLLVLTGCAYPLSYAEVVATATVTGCWPARYPTPVAPRQTAVLTDTLGTTTTVVLPTVTPLPLCPPKPGEAATPLPTPIPPPEPYPTMVAALPQNTGGLETAFALPGRIYQLDLATHPTENWPAVAVMHRQSLLDEPIQLYVRVFDPFSKRWGIAQQVDVGDSSAGQDPNGSIAVAISGDRTVHAVWGASDADGGLWTSASSDFGASWTKPERIATDCTLVADLQATVDGQLVALAMCGRLPTHPTLIVRRADGQWLPPQQLRIAARFGSLVVVGDGPTARVVAFVTGHGDGMPTDVGYLVSGNLGDGRWQVREVPLDLPGNYHFRQQGLAFARPQPNGSTQTGIVFTWKGQYSASLYALKSLDAGQTWGPVTPIVGGDRAAGRAEEDLAFVAPAYAAQADQLLAVWTCCGDAEEIEEATHYASSTTPGSATWQPATLQAAVPLVLGARSAGDTVSAQAPGAGDVWIAWVERHKEVLVRSVPAAQLVQEVVR
jgi:hypothetical protein